MEVATRLELDAFRFAVRADGQRRSRMGPGEMTWLPTSNSLVNASAMPF
jgi:hypothetical protein